MEITVRLWSWLEENPYSGKLEWPEWKFNGGDVPEMNCSCACCEYVAPDDRCIETCKDCPLVELWPVTHKRDAFMCEKGLNMYFGRWVQGVKATRVKNAGIIKQGALDALAKLEKED